MYCNCLLVSLAFRCTHEGSSIHWTIREKGERGIFPHFYVVLEDGTRIDFRSKVKPLKPVRQILFDGRLVVRKNYRKRL